MRGALTPSVDIGETTNKDSPVSSEQHIRGLELAAPLLKADDVADLLSVRPSTVYELSRRASDPLPSVRIGRSKRFDAEAVARWVSAHATG